MHDHDDMLQHLINELGCRGVILRILEGIPGEQQILLLKMLERDIDAV